MAKSTKKIKKTILTEKDKLKAEKEALHKVLKESGQLSVPVHKVHKNKKKYDRTKAKKELEEDLEQ